MASRFWVGGTGTWDNSTTTHWSASTGGAGGAAVPAAADTVTFDGASGGGTVTVAATINGTNTVNAITMGAFTGTLDFSVNNPSITTGFFNVTGTGVRTLNLGSGTFTITGQASNVWDATVTTSLTFSAGTSTIVFAPGSLGASATFVTGGLSYNIVTFGPETVGTNIAVNGAGTFATVNMVGPVRVGFPSGAAGTITNAINWAGTSANLIQINGGSTVSSITLSAAGGTISWASISGITFVTNSVTAANSFDLKSNTNATITNPSVGGGGVIGQ